MALPVLTPSSTTSSIVLPSASLPGDVVTMTYGVYTSDTYFLSGAADQVSYVYHKLGGDVIDIELTKEQVWNFYQEACFEYSMIVNMHQSKNVIYQLLGAATGSFDSDGQIQSGSSLDGVQVELKFPDFSFVAARKIAQAAATEYGLGGTTTIYSASFTTTDGVQDYDLQSIVSASSAQSSSLSFYNVVGNKRINITRVYYKTPHAYWRFFGYYGGASLFGNGSTYGQFKDDSTFEVVPVWQNKLQAQAYQDSLRVRTSHYSYELKNNKLRIFPVPDSGYNPEKMWIEFFVDKEPWSQDSNKENGVNGVNNMNTLPFENLPYQKINSIGKHWIRRFCLELCKETLGITRSKFSTIPIPGDSVTLDGPALISSARESQEKLREELKTILDDMVYNKLAESQAAMLENNSKILSYVPKKIYVG